MIDVIAVSRLLQPIFQVRYPACSQQRSYCTCELDLIVRLPLPGRLWRHQTEKKLLLSTIQKRESCVFRNVSKIFETHTTFTRDGIVTVLT